MNITTIKTKVKSNTGISSTRVNTIIEDRIDEVQDLYIIKNVYGHKWSWLNGQSALNTVASYSAGTVAITQDSTTVTGTSVAWTTAMEGYIIRFNDENEYYLISDVTGDVITLDKAYIGSDDAAATYEIVKVYYSLESDVKNVLWMKQVVTPRPVIPIAPLNFSRVMPDEFNSTGEIQGYIPSGMDLATEYMLVRFSPIPKVRKRVYYGYQKKFTTCVVNESSIPSDMHPLFIHKLSEFVYAAYDMAAKAKEEENYFNAMLFNIVNEDKDLYMDNDNVMEDEYIGVEYRRRPQLPDNYPRY